MKNVSYLIIVLIIIGLVLPLQNYCYCQEWDMTPQPPDASTFTTYGTFPVSYYTGTPNISIPIFTIKEGEISVPINLTYSGGGVKVATESSWVGLGWNLYPGGSISRIVVGSEFDNHDSEKYNILLNHWAEGLEADYLQRHGPTFFWGVLTGSDIYNIEGGPGGSETLTNISGANMSFFTSWANSAHLFQPDIYAFNFLGYSGKFYINPESDQIVVLDKKEHLVIERDATNWDPETDGWKIILPNGVKVYFQDKEKVYQAYLGNDCTNKSTPSLTWKITKIELKNGEEIQFAYANTTYETASITDYDYHAFEDDEDYYINYTRHRYGEFDVPVTIDNCADNGYPVIMRNELKTLSQINSPKYSVDFNLISSEEKPRLESIVISEKHDTSFKIGYRFSQEPFSCVDGAWNEWTNSGGVSQPFNTAENFVKRKLTRLQKYSIKNSSSTDLGNPHIFEYTEDIGLPSILSYAQDYWGYYNGQHNNTGLIPDESQMYATEGPYPVFSLPDRLPVDDLRKRANSNRGASANHMLQGTLKKIVYPTTGYTLFNFEPNKFYLPTDQEDYILLANEIYYSGVYYINNYNGSSSAISTGAGLRIKEISNYDYDGQFVSRKKFDYKESGLLLEPVHFWRIDPKVQVLDADDIFYYKTWSANATNHSQYFAIPNSVGYSHVSVMDSDSEFDHANEKINGSTSYHFHNYETVYNRHLSRVSTGFLDTRNGLPWYIQYFDENGNSVKKTEYHYTKISSSIFLSMAAKHPGQSSNTGYNIFKIEYTPMIADWWKEDWIEETQDNVLVRTDYDYSTDTYSNARLLIQTTTTSANDSVEVNYYYAHDNPSNIQTPSGTLTDMINANMVLVPLKTEKKVDGVLKEGTIVNYGADLYPSSTYKLQGSAYKLEETFDYDQGKIVGYQGIDDIEISFIWGYNNTLPIVKGTGVDKTTLQSAYTAVNGDLSILRNHSSLSNAFIHTYTYAPLAGISSQTDPVGITTYYEYDDFGRLSEVQNNDNHLVSLHKYNYKKTPSLSVDPTSLSYSSSGGNKTANVSSNINWTANYSGALINSVSPSSGSGDATLTINVNSNGSTGARSGTVTISDNSGGLPPVTVNVSQTGITPYLTLSNNFVNLYGYSSDNVYVTANVDWFYDVYYYEGYNWLNVTSYYTNGYNGVIDISVTDVPSYGNTWEAEIIVETDSGINRYITVLVTN